jgi:hypothetical protein
MTRSLVLRASELPDIATASLPATYERACVALETCHRIDECKDWADKAAALASYAKQADDKTLYTLAVRIQSRAIRRAGELLEEVDGRGALPKSGGAPTFTRPSRQDAATAAGMSKDQAVTAVRVARVPAIEFERAIESNNPPTVTALAERGTEKRPAAVVPPGFADATHVLGIVRELALYCADRSPDVVGAAILPHEVAALRSDAAAIDAWLKECFRHLPEATAC